MVVLYDTIGKLATSAAGTTPAILQFRFTHNLTQAVCKAPGSGAVSLQSCRVCTGYPDRQLKKSPRRCGFADYSQKVKSAHLLPYLEPNSPRKGVR